MNKRMQEIAGANEPSKLEAAKFLVDQVTEQEKAMRLQKDHAMQLETRMLGQHTLIPNPESRDSRPDSMPGRARHAPDHIPVSSHSARSTLPRCCFVCRQLSRQQAHMRIFVRAH